VRSLALPMPIDDVYIPRPLRILFVRSNPRGSAALALDRERDAIVATWLGALDTDIVDVAPTRAALCEQLDTRQFHVLHYMGHGGFSQATGDGALKLEHENGDSTCSTPMSCESWWRIEGFVSCTSTRARRERPRWVTWTMPLVDSRPP